MGLGQDGEGSVPLLELPPQGFDNLQGLRLPSRRSEQPDQERGGRFVGQRAGDQQPQVGLDVRTGTRFPGLARRRAVAGRTPAARSASARRVVTARNSDRTIPSVRSGAAGSRALASSAARRASLGLHREHPQRRHPHPTSIPPGPDRRPSRGRPERPGRPAALAGRSQSGDPRGVLVR